MPSPWTVASIARHYDRSIYQIQHVVRSRGIAPQGWAGNTRIFGDDAVAQIRAELGRIDRMRPEPVRPRCA